MSEDGSETTTRIGELPHQSDMNLFSPAKRLMTWRMLPWVLPVAGVLFFSNVLFTTNNFYFRDLLTFHYPLRRLLINSYAQGQLPLWNPYVYLGQPMLANLNFLACYPTNILHSFLPFNYAFKLHLIVHIILAGPGLYFLQRRLGIGPIAAFGGALVYEFSGTVLSFLNLYSIVPVVALMPWMGWAFLRAVGERHPRYTLAFGLLVATQVLAFEPILVQGEILLLAGLALLLVWTSSEPKSTVLNVLRVGLAGGVFAAGLAAIQLLPTLELLTQSIRGRGYGFEGTSWWSMHPGDLLNLAIPGLFGSYYTINHTLYWGEAFHNGREGYLVSLFIGPGALLLILASFWSVRKKLHFVFSGIAFISIFLALGRFNPLNHWLFTKVPGLGLGRYPVKYFLVGTLALSILAALGLEMVSRAEARRRRRLPLLGAALAGIAISLVLLSLSLYWHSHPQGIIDWMRATMEPRLIPKKDFGAISLQLITGFRSAGLFFLLSGAILLLAVNRGSRRVALAFALSTGAGLMFDGLRLAPLISDAEVNFVSDVNRYLREKEPAGLNRIISLDSMDRLPIRRLRTADSSSVWYSRFNRQAGMPMFGVMDGIQYSLYPSIDGLTTRDSDELLSAFSNGEGRAALALLKKINTPYLLTLGQIADPQAVLLASFDTGSDLNLNVYRLPGAQPRAYFVSGARPVESHGAALKELTAADFRADQSVILEQTGVPASAGELNSGNATILDYRNGSVRCQVDAAKAGYLVLLDSYYPGWHAYRDGQKVNTLKANYAFRAVEVPAGRHYVEFHYRPGAFRAGLIITLVTVLFGGCVLLMRRREWVWK